MTSQFLEAASAGNLARIELVVVDVDGSLTDGGKYVGTDNQQLYRYSVIDGLGVWLLAQCGIKVALVSSGSHASIPVRARELEAWDFAVGVTDKAAYLRSLAQRTKLSLEAICVLGDDLWDITAMRLAGVSVCPGDARPEVLEIASYRTRALGGQGSVRELADSMLKARGIGLDALLDLLH